LYLAQREEGYVNKDAMKDIASLLDITETDVASIVGFYTLYHDKKAGKYRMQVCTDLPCALRGADEFLNNLCGNLGIKVGETTEDGLVKLEEVMCLASCDRAPMFQTQGPDGIKYHEYMTVDRTMELIEALKQTEKEAK
jgi:NADH-quinone oxidoreductase subunit E